MTQRTRQEISEEVDQLAREVVLQYEEMSVEAARSLVWEEFPSLYDEYNEAAPSPDSTPVAKSARELTLAEEIAEVVGNKADRMLWVRWPDSTREELVWELFSDNPAVYELYCSDTAKLPASVARRQIAKGVHSDAFSLLREWAK